MPFDLHYTRTVLHAGGIQLLPEQEEILQQYVLLLEDWNTRVNLISRKDVHEIWRNHILHSLAGLSVLEIPDGARVLDIGTGGGLPGIPLAIVRPDAEFVLVDSIAKKMRAVSNMIDTLGLANATTATGRVEDIVKRNIVRFDIIVTRAVAQLDKLLAWCKPVLKPGLRIYAWKGGDLGEEIERARAAFPVSSITRHDFQLQGEDYFENEKKCLVEVRIS